jgi:tetratricopeptide (TPR) repeat protein
VRSHDLLRLPQSLTLAIALCLGPLGVGAPVSLAQQLVPDVPPVAEAVTRAIGATWLTDEERAELRVVHGAWTDADLAAPRRAGRVALDTWDLTSPAFDDPSVPPAWRAEALIRRGALNEALAALAGDDSPQAIAVKADALRWLGRRDEALAAARSIDRLLDDGATQSAVEIVAAARAALVRGELEPRSVADWQRVLDALGRARQAIDRLHWPSLLVEGTLLAERHHPEQAIPALVQAIQLGPKASEIWYRLGMMAVERFSFEDAERAVKALKRARAGHPLALLLEARVALERRDPDLAAQALDRLLEREPRMLEALALRASASATRHRMDEAREWLARLDLIAPGSALGQATVGRYLADARQYDVAAEFLHEAIRREPSWSLPHITLGLLETQTGRDDRSREALTEAMRLDPFNKRAQNSLLLLNELAGYKAFDGRHFIVRCKPGPDEIIAATMPAALDAMHEVVAGRFRHEPAQKTIIDLMPDHASFAVRITGMPQIHTIAACTGPLIAIEVPKEGPRSRHFGLFDWLKVLRHEYTHTITLSQTRNRIPHWLTEAAAVSMELTPRDWSTCQMLARELQQGTLFDLDSINWGFVRPIRPQDRHLAYSQGHWMVEFMNERFGEEALVRLLNLYSTGVNETEALPQALGVTREIFYRSFLVWASEQVRSWGLAPTPSMEDLVIAERSRDPELKAQFESATADALRSTAERIAERIGEPGDPKRDRLSGGEWTRADLAPLDLDESVMGRWLAEYPKHPDVLERALRRSMARLGDATIDPLTLQLVHRYMQARPVDPYPHRILAKLELASDNPTRAIPHLIELDMREEHNNAYAIELARLYRQAGDPGKASDSAERAVRMDPYDAALHELAAAIAIEAGELSLARRHVEALNRIEPGQPRHEARLRKLDELLGGDSKVPPASGR